MAKKFCMQTLQKAVMHAEHRYLTNLLSKATNNTHAAQLAGVTRTQLFRLLDRHDLPRITHADAGSS